MLSLLTINTVSGTLSYHGIDIHAIKQLQCGEKRTCQSCALIRTASLYFAFEVFCGKTLKKALRICAYDDVHDPLCYLYIEPCRFYQIFFII